MDLGIKALSDKPRLLEFSNANNIGITLEQGTANDIAHLIAFLKDEECKDLWARVEGIKIGHITIKNSELAQELVDLLALKCSKLKSFSCGDILTKARLTLSKELPMLRLIRWGKQVKNLETLEQLEALKAQCEARMG